MADAVDRSFWRQVAFENEGSAAALAGKSREDCPYSETGNEDDTFRWNHWVFGFDMAAQEMEYLKTGVIHFMNLNKELEKTREWTETAEEAYRNGNWRPRHVKVPEEWGPPPVPFPNLKRA